MALNITAAHTAIAGHCAWFVTWLHHWQDLAGALIGAFFLIVTVAWTLRAEHRRRAAEANAFRIALGAELRQLCAATLNIYEKLAEFVRKRSPTDKFTNLTISQFIFHCRYPEPVIYPRGADKLGALGEQPAFEAVYFYAQLALLREALAETQAEHPVGDENVYIPVSVVQVLTVMAALVSAADAAVKALPAFKGRTWTRQDATLASKCSAAVQEFAKLQDTRGLPEQPAAKTPPKGGAD